MITKMQFGFLAAMILLSCDTLKSIDPEASLFPLSPSLPFVLPPLLNKRQKDESLSFGSGVTARDSSRARKDEQTTMVLKVTRQNVIQALYKAEPLRKSQHSSNIRAKRRNIRAKRLGWIKCERSKSINFRNNGQYNKEIHGQTEQLCRKREDFSIAKINDMLTNLNSINHSNMRN